MLIAERWILARLRNRTFFTWPRQRRDPGLLDGVNDRPFKKLDGSRRSALRGARAAGAAAAARDPYEFAIWQQAAGQHRLPRRGRDATTTRCPTSWSASSVDVRLSAATVEVFSRPPGGPHVRSYAAAGHTTDPAHMPESHRRHAEWTPERIIGWAGQTGPATAALVAEHHGRPAPPRAGLPLCLGIIRLAGATAPSARGRLRPGPGVGAFLPLRRVDPAHGLDRQPLPAPPAAAAPATTTCAAPATTTERRHTMLTPPPSRAPHAQPHGMARALAEQLERPDYPASASRSASGCWSTGATDRENRRLERIQGGQAALDRQLEDIDFRRPRGLERAHRPLSLAEAHWVDATSNVVVIGRHRARQDLPRLRPRQRRHPPRPHGPLPARVPRLLDELALARADGRFARLLVALGPDRRPVIDDLVPRRSPATRRPTCSRSSRTATSCAPPSSPASSRGHWHEALGEPTIADAILDRLLTRPPHRAPRRVPAPPTTARPARRDRTRAAADDPLARTRRHLDPRSRLIHGAIVAPASTPPLDAAVHSPKRYASPAATPSAAWPRSRGSAAGPRPPGSLRLQATRGSPTPGSLGQENQS